MAIYSTVRSDQENYFKLPDLPSRVREVFYSAAAVILQETDLSPLNPRVAKALSMLIGLCRKHPQVTPDILNFDILPGIDPEDEIVERVMLAERELEKHFARLIISRGIQRHGLDWQDLKLYPWFKDYLKIFNFEYPVLKSALDDMAPLASVGYLGPGALPIIPMMLTEQTGRNVLAIDTDTDCCDLANRIVEDMGYGDKVRVFWGDGMNADMLMGVGMLVLSNSPQRNDGALLGVLAKLKPRYVFARVPAGLAKAIFPSVNPMLITSLGYKLVNHACSNGASTNDGMLFRRD